MPMCDAMWRSMRGAMVCACILIGMGGARAAADAPTSRPADAETPLGDTSTYDGIKAVVMSVDARHLAFLGVKSGKQYIVADGNPGPAYDWILPDSLFVIADGQAAYIVQNDDTMQVSVGGRLDKPYQEIQFDRLFVSPDGKKAAYIAILPSKKMVVVLDGQEGPTFDSIDFPLFSPDSQHLAYRAESDGVAHVVVDGQVQPGYDTVVGISLSFSPDSQRVAYEAVRKGQHVIVIDGREAAQCNALRAGPGFSPDSKRWAAAIAADASDPSSLRTNVMIDGKIGPTYDAIFAGDMRFSPDSKHFAFGAMRDKRAFVVLDGVEKLPVDDIGSHTLVFSPDSAHFAFAALDGHDQVVVSDSKMLKGWQAIQAGTPLFSPDSKHLAYVGQQSGSWTEVIDDKEYQPWDLAGVPLFSPDSSRVAYRTVTGKQSQAVIDGVASPIYDGVDPISFSPDSRHTMYVAKSGGVSRIYVDGLPGISSYDIHSPDGPAIFDDVNTAHLISLRKGKFYRVTVKMPGK
jgi:WD40-like Beta Propeller Repeat